MKQGQTEDARNIKATVLNTLELITYQNDSIVSREIVRKTAGTVTLFAFDQGQALSEHTAPYDALASVIEGEVDITISGKEHRLAAGQLIIMPAGEPHAVRATTQLKMMLIMIKA